ncbi:hypothetical protein EDC04DRAFT_2611845 [Pisolithus marmoratus]|nr:hypothetical protein EDC04DRAFT_2611845 [Pisolithus marmoratus]
MAPVIVNFSHPQQTMWHFAWNAATNVLGMAPTSSQLSNIVPQKTACTEALGTKKVAKPSQLTKVSTSTGDHKSSHGNGRSFWSKGCLLDQMLPGGYRRKAEFLITLQNHGCLIQTQQHESRYLINMSWSYEEVTTALQGWFPKVQSQKDKAALQPDWQVLNCSQGYNFSVVWESFPTGQMLSTFKGHAKAGTSDSRLWLGTDNEGDNSTGEVQSLDEDQSSSEDLIDLSSSFTDLGFNKLGTGNIPMLLLCLTNAGIPKVTPVLDAIEVSESDQFLQGVIDDKKAPHMTSAWDEDFAFTPKLKDHDISDLCGFVKVFCETSVSNRDVLYGGITSHVAEEIVQVLSGEQQEYIVYKDISSQDYIYIMDQLDSAGYAKPWKRLTFFPGSQVLMASSPSDAHKLMYVSDYPDLLVVGKIILNQAMSYHSPRSNGSIVKELWSSELLTADKWGDRLGDQDTFSQVVVDGHTWFSLSSVEIHIWIWQPADTRIILDCREGEGYMFRTVYLTAHLDDINKAFWCSFCLLKETIVHELEKISDVEQATIRSMDDWSPPSQLLDPNVVVSVLAYSAQTTAYDHYCNWHSKLKKKPYSATKHCPWASWTASRVVVLRGD